eukprot:10709654-Alexandrium_andersonii.AAC.1
MRPLSDPSHRRTVANLQQASLAMFAARRALNKSVCRKSSQNHSKRHTQDANTVVPSGLVD